MKTFFSNLLIVLLLWGTTRIAHSQGTAFFYQGRLNEGVNGAIGLFDFRFAVYDALNGGAQQGSIISQPALAVSNGLFSASINFGNGVFTGAPRWLEIAVRTNGAGAFTILSPRQPLTATPYSITAGAVTGPVNGNQIVAGTVTGTQLAAGAVTATSIASNSITAGQLASGAAAANLAATGQSGVASGGLVLSATENPALVSAGYVRINARVNTEDFWQARPNSPAPSGRSAHSVVWTGSDMIVWGGYNGAHLNDGARYSPAANAWTTLPGNGAPSPRTGHTAVWTGTEMIIWGGANSVFLNDGARYNPSANTWTTVTTTGAPTGRYEHTAVWTGSRMVVWGGSNGGFFNDGARYNPSNNTWTQVTATGAPGLRTRHTAVWTGTEMIVWGGLGAVSSLANGGRYNPVADAWAPVSTTGAAAARAFHTAVWTGSEMIIWGGTDVSYLNTGARYNPASNTWSPLPVPAGLAARRFHSAVWTGTDMIVWGGFNGAPLTSSGVYNPTNNSWFSSDYYTSPSPRYEHTAVWTGSRMIVWGGAGTNGVYFDDGGRFDPTSGSAVRAWNRLSGSGAMQGRWGPEAVWTGSELIVWGGQGEGSGNFLNDGFRYNPAANSWLATTLVGAPGGRRDHTLLWTGSHMLVWGGWNGGYFADGSRYNPVANSWDPMSLNAALAGRAIHGSVWTGTEMIVWGGYSAGDGDGMFYNDGGRYNPTLNTWSQVTLSGAPPARGWHTAVWTGKEMIVWGGLNDLNSISHRNDGGRYNPAANTWAGVTTNGAPSPRAQHTAIWTGSQMIVCGGESFTGSYDIGSYNPAANSWLPVSTVGAPVIAGGHTAIWTGTEMIVWGGDSGNGGRYNPTFDAWAAITALGMPPVRRQHTAVWTGNDMLIWGGDFGSGFYTDTWSYTPPRSLFLYQKF